MEPARESRSDEPHLSQISTSWTQVFRAHGDEPAQQVAAREELLRVYGNAIRRYLMAILRREEAVEELYQEFALKLVKGDFRRVHPDRGRFRDFLKTVLYHLVVDHYRRQRATSVPLNSGCEPAAPSAEDRTASEQQFLEAWRNELLARSWRALETFELTTGQLTFTALRARVDRSELSSRELAELLTQELGQTVSEAWVRKRVFLARRKLSEFVRREVEQTLDDPDEEQINEELEALGLRRYLQ